MCCVSCFVCLFACLLECSPPFKVGLFDFLQIPSPSLSAFLLLLPIFLFLLPPHPPPLLPHSVGGCRPLVWRLPNSGVAAAKPEGYSIMTWMYPWMCIHGSRYMDISNGNGT